MSENKIYAGSAKFIKTQFGDLTKVSFSKSDLAKLVQYQSDNDTEWVNLVIKEKKEKVEGKATHYLEVDEWKPNGMPKQMQGKPSVQAVETFDNLPF